MSTCCQLSFDLVQQLRLVDDDAEELQATGAHADAVPVEPSHVHIPRPSRVSKINA